jgi:hypothetical protein
MFFFQFLDAGDRWREFLANCPLDYIGNGDWPDTLGSP